MKIIAHRGNDDNLNENRMDGLLSCLSKDYIDGIEFDIQMTKDSKFVLSHSNFLKTKNSLISIRNQTLKHLKEQKFLKNGKEYFLAELSELLDKINSNKMILIEIKIENMEKSHYQKLHKILKKYTNLNLWIFSFNDKNLSYFDKKYKIGLLKTRIVNYQKDDTKYDFISVNYKGDFSKPYFLWTINKKIDFPKDSNFIGIITDKPKIFKNI